MNNVTEFYINRLLSQLSSNCSSAKGRIRTSATIRAVKFAADLHVNAMIRSLADAKRELHGVRDCAEKRMEELLGQQLKALEACQSSEQLRHEYGVLVRNDWIFLRGEFGRLYSQADRGYRRLLYEHTQRETELRGAPPEAEVEADDHEGEAPKL